MPDLWMDVDTALSEVPVNIAPLIDDTDFKTIEGAVAYDAAGMTLFWHFVTTGGAYTLTAVTPTTAGDYDWTDQGAAGIYTIEIPASGGASINNDTEGFGWFTGVATGVLPWRGPTIGFRAAALNNSLIDGTTIDVNVTAMAANVATASALAADAVAEIADGVWDEARSGHVTDGTFGQAFQVIDSGTAQGGGTNTITLRAAYSSGDDRINGCLVFILSGTGAGQGNTANDYNNTTKVLTCDNNWPVTPDNTSVYILYPGSLAATTTAIGGAVWNSARASYATAGTFGEGVLLASTAIQAIWDALTSALTTAGSIGKLLVDNINATISSRASQTSVDTVDDFLDTEVAAIKTKTDFLPSATAGAAGGVFIAGSNAATTADLTGNITGNLSGSVGSVTAGVTLAASAVQAIWDALTSALTTSGSIGKRIVDYLTGDIFARLGAPAGASVSADMAAVKSDTAAILVDTGTTLDARIPAALVGGRMDSNVGAISSDATAADNAESFFDGTGYAGTNNVIPTVTTLTNKTGFSLADSPGIKINTALAAFPFYMVSSSDHATPATGLTITATRSIDGAAFAACANSATEISAGWYKIDLAAADLNGTNIALKFTATNADATCLSIVTET